MLWLKIAPYLPRGKARNTCKHIHHVIIPNFRTILKEPHQYSFPPLYILSYRLYTWLDTQIELTAFHPQNIPPLPPSFVVLTAPDPHWKLQSREIPSRATLNLLQDEGSKICSGREPCKGAETDSRAKFGKETVAGAQRRPKWVPYYGSQADSERAQDAQALLRFCLGSAQAPLRHDHPRLRYTHPQLRLKQ